MGKVAVFVRFTSLEEAQACVAQARADGAEATIMLEGSAYLVSLLGSGPTVDAVVGSARGAVVLRRASQDEK